METDKETSLATIKNKHRKFFLYFYKTIFIFLSVQYIKYIQGWAKIDLQI